MATTDQLVDPDDGLPVSETGSWSTKKHRLIRTYAEMFSTGMKYKWDCRIYVDLFAGAGRASIKGRQQIVDGSPLIALQVRDGFDKYVFCEAKPRLLDALRQRVKATAPEADVQFVLGDSNCCIDKILQAIPASGRSLGFCVADPFSTGDLAFDTLRALGSKCRFDFLVLIATFMDAHRNVDMYAMEGENRIDKFVGDAEWRVAWAAARERDPTLEFGMFLLNHHDVQMKRLGYEYGGKNNAETVCLKGKQRLYHLAFYSKHKRGLDFWKKAQKSSDDQMTLFTN